MVSISDEVKYECNAEDDVESSTEVGTSLVVVEVYGIVDASG